MDREQLRELQDIIDRGPFRLQTVIEKYENNLRSYTEQEYMDALRRKLTSSEMLQKAYEYASVGNMYKTLYYSNKAIFYNPDNVEARVTRGAVYARLGEMNEAFIDTQDSLMLNPTYDAAKMLMSNVLVYFSKLHINQRRSLMWLDSLLLAKKYNPSNRVVDELLSIAKYKVRNPGESGMSNDEFSLPSIRLVARVYERVFSRASIRRIRERYNEDERRLSSGKQVLSTSSTSQTRPK